MCDKDILTLEDVANHYGVKLLAVQYRVKTLLELKHRSQNGIQVSKLARNFHRAIWQSKISGSPCEKGKTLAEVGYMFSCS